jgi:hypothetical protein
MVLKHGQLIQDDTYSGKNEIYWQTNVLMDEWIIRQTVISLKIIILAHGIYP